MNGNLPSQSKMSSLDGMPDKLQELRLTIPYIYLVTVFISLRDFTIFSLYSQGKLTEMHQLAIVMSSLLTLILVIIMIMVARCCGKYSLIKFVLIILQLKYHINIYMFKIEMEMSEYPISSIVANTTFYIIMILFNSIILCKIVIPLHLRTIFIIFSLLIQQIFSILNFYVLGLDNEILFGMIFYNLIYEVVGLTFIKVLN